MTSQQTLEKVRQLVADVLGVGVNSIEADSGLDITDGWDSLQHLSIMMAIEEDLTVQFSPEELSENRTVRQIVATLENR